MLSKTANYTVSASECDAVFTNAGATGAVTFTLPSAAVGLRFLFVVAAAQTVVVQRNSVTDTIIENGTGAASRSSNSQFDFLSVVCFEAGEWLVDRSYGF